MITVPSADLIELGALRGDGGYARITRVLTREALAERFLVENTNTKGCWDATASS